MLLQALQYQKAERGTAVTKSIALGADVFCGQLKRVELPTTYSCLEWRQCDSVRLSEICPYNNFISFSLKNSGTSYNIPSHKCEKLPPRGIRWAYKKAVLLFANSSLFL